MPSVVEVPADDGHREPVGFGERGVRTAFDQQVRDVAEPAPDGVGVRGLPAGVRGVDVGTMIQQKRYRRRPTATGGYMQRRLATSPVACGQVGAGPAVNPICISTERLSHSAHASTITPARSRYIARYLAVMLRPVAA
jgi:hypothetical protein